jgi:hypothetical protein
MSDLPHDEEEFELVPVPMSAQTRSKLNTFAHKVGEYPIMAAAMLLEDLLEDQDFWDSVDDPHGVEPKAIN